VSAMWLVWLLLQAPCKTQCVVRSRDMGSSNNKGGSMIVYSHQLTSAQLLIHPVMLS
jgi:hypothetical protein